MSRRDYHNYDDDPFPYGRPSVSSWIAAVAVAFAFFVVGGFVKTYMELETLREESQREIRELRTIVEGMRASGTQPRSPARVQPLPRATRTVRDREPRASLRPPGGEGTTAPQRSAALSEEELHRQFPELKEDEQGVSYEFGRRSEPASATLQSQVIAVSGQKRVIVEGGRNSGIDEGTRLALYRGGRWISELRVMDVYDNMAACEVLHSTTPPQPGDAVRKQ